MKKIILIAFIFLSACTSNNKLQTDTAPIEYTQTPSQAASLTPTITPSPTFTITPSSTLTSTPSPTPTPIKIDLDSWQDLELINVHGYGEIINVSYSKSDTPYGIGFNHGVLFFDPKDNKELGSYSSLELLTNVAVSPDGKYGAVSAEIDNIPYIFILDSQTGEVIERISDIENPILYVEYSSTGKWLASGGFLGIDIWDTSTWKKTKSFEGYGANFLDFSSNDNYLASIYSTNFQVWDLTDETADSPIFYKRFYNPLTSLSFHPDNNTIALTQDEGNILLFDIDKKVETTRWIDPDCGKESRNIFPSILFINGGAQLASSCDNRVIVWDTFSKSILWDKSFSNTYSIKISPGPDDLSFNVHYIREKYGIDENDNNVFTKIILLESASGVMLNEMSLPTYSWCVGGNKNQYYDDLFAKLGPIWGASRSNKYLNPGILDIPDIPGYYQHSIVKSNDAQYIASMYFPIGTKIYKLIIFDSTLDLNNPILSIKIEPKKMVAPLGPVFNNESTQISYVNDGRVLTYELPSGNLLSDVDLTSLLTPGYILFAVDEMIYTEDGMLIIYVIDRSFYFMNPSTGELLGKIEAGIAGGNLVFNTDGSELALPSCGVIYYAGHINHQSDRIVTIWGINSSSEK